MHTNCFQQTCCKYVILTALLEDHPLSHNIYDPWSIDGMLFDSAVFQEKKNIFIQDGKAQTFLTQMSVMQNSPLEKTMLATIQYSYCTFQNSGKSVQHTERTGSRKRQTLQIKRTTHETGHERIIHSFAHFKTMYLYTYLSNTWLRAGV